jgi:hypothetical protein
MPFVEVSTFMFVRILVRVLMDMDNVTQVASCRLVLQESFVTVVTVVVVVVVVDWIVCMATETTEPATAARTFVDDSTIYGK